MNIKKITLALGFAVISPSLFAAPSDLANVPVANIFYMAGASAQTPAIAATISSWCNNTVDTYTQNAKDSFVYHCSSAKASVVPAAGVTAISTPFASAASFIIVKMDKDGSFNGVGPVSKTYDVTSFPKFANIADCNTTANTSAPAAAIAGNNAGSCGLEGTVIRPQIGLSDVPKTVWRAKGLLTTAVENGLSEVTKFGGQGFGIVVSAKLYKAMQQDQFGALGVNYTGSERPSISKTQYAALVSGEQGVWHKLLPKNAELYRVAKAAVTDGSGNVGTIALPSMYGMSDADKAFPPATTLKLTRRVSTSGTQAASDIYFLNNPCGNTTLPGQLNPKSAGNYVDSAYYKLPVTFTVTEESSSSGVTTGAKSTADYNIGVVSLEVGETNANLGTGKYLKLDGVDPTPGYQKANTVNGTYDFAYEAVIIKPAVTSAATATSSVKQNTPAPTLSKGVQKIANVDALATAFKKFLGNPSTLSTMNGVYADPASGYGVITDGQTNHYSRSNNVCKTASWLW